MANEQSVTVALDHLFATVSKSPAAQTMQRRLEKGGVLSCADVALGAQPFLIALLRRLFPGQPILAVARGVKAQEALQQDVETWLRFQTNAEAQGNEKSPHGPDFRPPLFYPAWEVLPHEAKLPHADVISERLETLLNLTDYAAERQGAAPVVVANVIALLQRTYAPDLLRTRLRRLRRGQEIEPLALAEWLHSQGYEPEAKVTNKGEISLRGGILDVFPPTSPWPVRLEFFGEELDSLRNFDPVTQISRESIAEIFLPPAGELGTLKRDSGEQSEPGAGLGTLLDYLPDDTILVLCEADEIHERASEYAQGIPAGDRFFVSWESLLEQACARQWPQLHLNEAQEIGASGDQAEDEPDLEKASLSARSGVRAPPNNREEEPDWEKASPDDRAPLPQPEPSVSGDLESPLRFNSLEAFRPIVERSPEPQVAEVQRREFFEQLQRWLRQGYAVHVFCNNNGERQRFAEIWADYGLGRIPLQGGPAKPSQDIPALHLGTLTRGFLSEEAKLVIVTDAEVFGRYKVQRPRRLKSPHAQATRSLLEIDFSDLEDGDYVVHVEHGIGRYLGLQMLPPGGGIKPLEKAAHAQEGAQEYLVIEYAASDPAQPAPKLYVPVSEAHLVSKYVGAGKARPALNTLGGNRWSKTKEQAERAVRDLAGELLSIQAARESQPGYSFAADAPWQREFESAFLFEETPDQMRAIVETKGDMEKAKPMDRLICGDVGYGKTEVAIRAAFKAVMGGKQAAVLVPTTVLAQQHYNTFRERMADYPIRIEMLSRFRTARAQKKIIQDLQAGAIDIIIGTHRLVQEDVSLKDLGLVVIDEEQRFGVMHKEKFKMLRKLVDVLTLSATPIPRTLYLALTGARDMSTIQTPPADRLPVETIVTQYDERIIRDAIVREMNRGGQVFFLHNRVSTIDVLAEKLKTLVPKARLVVGHGQMHADDLEEVMAAFINGEADVLLSTTIIESGLDIPNANTIIIDRADRFGLSDLYQLRGRVGRYKHQAYAYLLLPRHAGLLTDARKRISAIKQYSSLGSGFKIAMRDLEIRGAGNLLGAQQSGHITAVGFDLYCQLLKQSVSSLKGEKVKPRVEVQVRLDFLPLSPAEEEMPSGAESGEAVVELDGEGEEGSAPPPVKSRRATHAKADSNRAYIPLSYISDLKQRIEFYRKIAGIMDKESMEEAAKEMRDRFGPLPGPVELLLEVTELKLLASQKGITCIETEQDKLKLTRNNDLITLGGKFPRLTKTSARARLKEIKRLVLAC